MTFTAARTHRVVQRAVTVLAVLVLMVMGPVRAQIYEWVDDENDSHFATSLEEAPPEKRADAKLVVGASTRTDSDASAVENQRADTDQATDEPETSETEFTAGWDAGFEAGWYAGQRAAAAEQPICPANAPVVVLESPPPVTVNVPRYDPTGAYYQPSQARRPAGPFDDGASMGMTYRERVQDLRALERGW